MIVLKNKKRVTRNMKPFGYQTHIFPKLETENEKHKMKELCERQHVHSLFNRIISLFVSCSKFFPSIISYIRQPRIWHCHVCLHFYRKSWKLNWSIQCIIMQIWMNFSKEKTDDNEVLITHHLVVADYLC